MDKRPQKLNLLGAIASASATLLLTLLSKNPWMLAGLVAAVVDLVKVIATLLHSRRGQASEPSQRCSPIRLTSADGYPEEGCDGGSTNEEPADDARGDQRPMSNNPPNNEQAIDHPPERTRD
jgi:hypothetical protein